MSGLDLSALRDVRARSPGAILEAAAGRQRRVLLPEDGRLMLLAADHPARGAISVAGNRMAMADRRELLERLVTSLGRPGVDGVLGTADVLEDLLLLGSLDEKVVIGSMNRGGLAGSTFEMDDRFTGYDAATLAQMGFEGGKMLTRIDYDDPGSLDTLETSAKAISDLADHGLLALVEPFISRRVDGKVENDLSTAAVTHSIVIASALGTTSRNTWLKLPAVDDMEQVMSTTTLPTLLLGGDPTGPAEDHYARWRQRLALPGVRGLIIGRALLYPPDGDVVAAVDAAAAMVHPIIKGRAA